MTSRKIFQHLLHVIFFMFALLISSNNAVFLFNLESICICKFFEKLKLHLSKQLIQFQFLKNSLVQINSKLNSMPYDYLYQLLFVTSPEENKLKYS